MVKLECLNTDKLLLKFNCDGRDYPFSFSEEHAFKMSNNELIFIPKGMKFDFASIPRIVEWMFFNLDSCAVAYAVHDYLYISDYKRNDLGDYKARLFADREMLIILDKINRNRFSNRVQYYACRLFGSSIYKLVDKRFSTYNKVRDKQVLF